MPIMRNELEMSKYQSCGVAATQLVAGCSVIWRTIRILMTELPQASNLRPLFRSLTAGWRGVLTAVMLLANAPISGCSSSDGMVELRGTVTLESSADEKTIQALRQAVNAHCPVLDIVARPVPVDLDIAIVKPGSRAAAE